VRFEILGPLRISGPKGVVGITAPKPSRLLAALILHRGRHLSMEELCAATWGLERPVGVNGIAQTYISRLRQVIDGVGGAGADVLPQAAHGYNFQAGDAYVDTVYLECKLTQAAGELGKENYERALVHTEEALGVVRGPLLGNLEKGPVLYAWEQVYREREMELQEIAIQCLLSMQQPKAALLRAIPLAAQEPLREGFTRALMVAHCRCGQAPQAAAAYRALRKRLMDEFAMEPSRELAELNTKIIRGDTV
jgi:DNA-binding SARP family transcriptional activator